MKYHIFYNMLAGLGDSKDKVEKLTESLDGEPILHDVATTSYRELIASIDTEDIIVICGGDGTINRFVNDTYDLEYPNEVLYFPTGSGNDFMRDVEGTPDKPISIKQYIKNLPSVEVNGKTYRFINNVGFGLDGYCCAKGDDIKAAGGGNVNYTAIAIKGLLFHYKPTNAIVTVDGKEYRYKKVWIAPTMKGRYYGGGMMPCPDQDRLGGEGIVSCCVFHDTSKLGTLMIFPSLFKGEHVKHEKKVEVRSGKHITVEFDSPRPLQIDGETIKGVTKFSMYYEN